MKKRRWELQIDGKTHVVEWTCPRSEHYIVHVDGATVYDKLRFFPVKRIEFQVAGHAATIRLTQDGFFLEAVLDVPGVTVGVFTAENGTKVAGEQAPAAPEELRRRARITGAGLLGLGLFIVAVVIHDLLEKDLLRPGGLFIGVAMAAVGSVRLFR